MAPAKRHDEIRTADGQEQAGWHIPGGRTQIGRLAIDLNTKLHGPGRQPTGESCHPVFQFVDKNLLRSVTPDSGVDQQRGGCFQPEGDEDPRLRLIGKVDDVKAVARKRPKPQLSPGLQSFFSA